MKELIESVSEYLSARLNIDRQYYKISKINYKTIPGVIQLEPFNHGIPRLILVTAGQCSDAKQFIPYHRIHERPDRQIMSYTIGKNLSNLAEVNEIKGKLYSRSCLSYGLHELVHRHPIESRIGLWVHDCLTEDLDHHKSLNRKILPGGASISFDFGLAFSCRYYPPFYTAELGLGDEEIIAHQDFLTALLSEYSGLLAVHEDLFLTPVQKLFPETHHLPLCRYYLENFKSLFPIRLLYGRFFEKIKKSKFDPESLAVLARAIGLGISGLDNWEQFITKLRGIRPVPMNLQGLNLSGLDLRNADFKDADLREANLSGSNMEGADFRGADLRGTNLEGVLLKRASMEGAVF